MRAVLQGLALGAGGDFTSVTFGNVLACGIFLATVVVGFSALAIPAHRSRFAPGGVVVGLGGIGFAGFVLRWFGCVCANCAFQRTGRTLRHPSFNLLAASR